MMPPSGCCASSAALPEREYLIMLAYRCLCKHLTKYLHLELPLSKGGDEGNEGHGVRDMR